MKIKKLYRILYCLLLLVSLGSIFYLTFLGYIYLHTPRAFLFFILTFVSYPILIRRFDTFVSESFFNKRRCSY